MRAFKSSPSTCDGEGDRPRSGWWRGRNVAPIAPPAVFKLAAGSGVSVDCGEVARLFGVAQKRAGEAVARERQQLVFRQVERVGDGQIIAVHISAEIAGIVAD